MVDTNHILWGTKNIFYGGQKTHFMVFTVLDTLVAAAVAAQAIMGSYEAIGILEHWELSMQLFDAKVRSPVKDWQNIQISNSGKKSELRDSVHKWAHMSPEIHSILATDMLLYDYAFSVFKMQTTETLGTVWPE